MDMPRQRQRRREDQVAALTANASSKEPAEEVQATTRAAVQKERKAEEKKGKQKDRGYKKSRRGW